MVASIQGRNYPSVLTIKIVANAVCDDDDYYLVKLSRFPASKILNLANFNSSVIYVRKSSSAPAIGILLTRFAIFSLRNFVIFCKKSLFTGQFDEN